MDEHWTLSNDHFVSFIIFEKYCMLRRDDDIHINLSRRFYDGREN